MLEVFWASNRDLGGSQTRPLLGKRFNALGPQYFRVGCADVDPQGYRPQRIVVLPEHLDDHGAAPVAPLYGSDTLFAQLKARMAGRGQDALVLIHGFASSFETTIARSAEIADRWRPGDRPLPVFVFSWPSDGEIVPSARYVSDRDDAAGSGLALARALMALLGFLRRVHAEGSDCGQRLHLVAHSMGNWALRFALQALRGMLGTDRLPQVFETVFLMAADEDDDALEHDHKLGLLPRLAAQVLVYHARGDRALMVSDLTKANPARLGSAGPRTRDGLSARIQTIDCSLVAETALGDAGHQYYRCRPEVIADVRQVLAGTAAEAIAGRRWSPAERSWRILPAANGAVQPAGSRSLAMNRDSGARRSSPNGPVGQHPARA